MRAGIGDAAHLKSIGITPLYDNPHVGQHLKNHTIVMATFTRNVQDAPSPNPNDLYDGGAFTPDPRSPSDSANKARHLQAIVV